MGFMTTTGRVMLNLGIDPRLLKNIRNLGRYLRDRRLWIEQGGSIDAAFPILGDFNERAGTANGHYFHMDLLVAGFIAQEKPARHLDIGSRVDGFVAHVAAFRDIEVMDIRPISFPAHPQIRFIQGDLMSCSVSPVDSVSCLHVLEHVGLGRYGDPVNSNGHRSAFTTLVDLVLPGGTLYFAVPVGVQKTMFNAHRVFDPLEILAWETEKLELRRFDHVDDAGVLHLNTAPADAAGLEYGCGIYTFTRRELAARPSDVKGDDRHAI
jgi:hypothetical protein